MQFERVEELSFPIWGAKIGGYQFIITNLDKGYAASWKDSTLNGAQSAKAINDSFESPYSTMREAELACQQQYRILRDKMQ